MKRFLVLITLTFVIGVSACNRIPEPDLKKSDVVEIKGKLYHKSDTSKPVNGTVGEFHSNNELKSITEYSNGVKNGAKKIYSLEGDLRLHFVYDSGRVQSVEQEKKTDSIEYYDNGLPYKITYYKRGKKRKFEEYYKNGYKKEVKKWSVKENVVKRIMYFEDGNIQAMDEYSDDGKLKFVMQNYENNKPYFRHKVAMNKEDKKRAYALDGWYKNGEKAYHFESPKNESMRLYPNTNFYDAREIIDDAFHIENGKGFSNYPDGSKEVKAFFKGEYRIKAEDGTPIVFGGVVADEYDEVNISTVKWGENGIIRRVQVYETHKKLIDNHFGGGYKKLKNLLNNKGYVKIN